MAPAYPGARPYAWYFLGAYWIFGAVVGVLGYWELLFSTSRTWPALQTKAGVYAVLLALGAIAFLKIPLFMGAFRMGRPLSRVSLAVFPLANALLEGFALLFLFDAGRRQCLPLTGHRWILAEEDWKVEPGSVGFAALQQLPMNDRRLWREFLLGFAPYTIGYIAMYACVWEEHILPVHMDLGTTNKFVRAMVMVNMALVAIYWLFADVTTYCALRFVNELLMVLCVRLPPPGAKVAPAIHPSDVGATPSTGVATTTKRRPRQSSATPKPDKKRN